MSRARCRRRRWPAPSDRDALAWPDGGHSPAVGERPGAGPVSGGMEAHAVPGGTASKPHNHLGPGGGQAALAGDGHDNAAGRIQISHGDAVAQEPFPVRQVVLEALVVVDRAAGEVALGRVGFSAFSAAGTVAVSLVVAVVVDRVRRGLLRRSPSCTPLRRRHSHRRRPPRPSRRQAWPSPRRTTRPQVPLLRPRPSRARRRSHSLASPETSASTEPSSASNRGSRRRAGGVTVGAVAGAGGGQEAENRSSRRSGVENVRILFAWKMRRHNPCVSSRASGLCRGSA